MRILIVDDEEMIRGVLREYIEFEGNEEEESADEASAEAVDEAEAVAEAEAVTDASQLTMEIPVYDHTPERIDFSLITGTENETVEEAVDEEKPLTITDDILDAYASFNVSDGNRGSSRSDSRKKGLLSRLTSDRSDEKEEKPSGRRSILSFAEEKLPAPPKFDLSRKKEKEEETKVSFVPPENDAPSKLYNDDFFASYDPDEDDKTFSSVKRKREEISEGDFDFWPLKK